MSYAPSLVTAVTPDVISTASPLCPASFFRGVTGAAASGSQAPGANLAYYIPIYLPTPKTFVRAFWHAGTTVTGNVDVGLIRYSDSVKLVSTGAVAVGTTAVVNDAALTNTTVLILPGWYWLAISASATTANLWSVAASLQFKNFGCKLQATAHPLPATATPALWTSNICPTFGLTSKTFV